MKLQEPVAVEVEVKKLLLDEVAPAIGEKEEAPGAALNHWYP
jgi:hypothetical protein